MEPKTGALARRHRLYCFGPFQLDAAARVLLREGRPVHLTRKAVETLLVLVENAGQVVTKEEILSAVWPDRIVDEANLAQNIAVIRKALGTGKGESGYIETFPGRGYRFAGTVTVTDAAPGNVAVAEPEPRPVPRRRPSAILIGPVILLVAVIAAIWVLRRSATLAPPDAVVHPLPVARQAGKEYQPAITADGSRMAFVWERSESGVASVWIRDVGEKPPQRASGEGTEAFSPAWSPDSRRLAYLKFQGSTGSLAVRNLETGEEKILCPVFPSRYGLANRHLDWSPDGQWLAVDDAESLHEAFGIFLVSVATGQRKRLTRPDNVYIGDVDPRFSPDGRYVSFIRAFHRAHQELFVISVEGGEPRQLTFDGKQISGQDWSPDGAALLFGSDRTGEFRVWKLADWAKPNRRAVPTGIYGEFPIQLAMARRARVLIYSVLQHDLNIWRLDLGPTAAGERWRRVIASPGKDASPQYSPDGKRICFRSDRSGDEQLWVADGDGNNAVQVTRGNLWPSVGRWSPGGDALVFNNARNGEIFLARETSPGRWEVRSTGATGYHPVFSPEGDWIYAGTMSAIVRIPVRGGPAAQLAATRGISLDVSRDGKYVYFVREATDMTLWRAETSSGRIEKVLEGLLPYCSSCWVLTTRGIYYLGAREGPSGRQALFFQEFAGARPKALLDYPEPLSPIGSGPFSLSPEGRYLLCVRVDPSNADVYRVENFR